MTPMLVSIPQHGDPWLSDSIAELSSSIKQRLKTKREATYSTLRIANPGQSQHCVHSADMFTIKHGLGFTASADLEYLVMSISLNLLERECIPSNTKL